METIFYYLDTNKKLGKELGELLATHNLAKVGAFNKTVFADGEIKIRAHDHVEGKRVVILATTSAPVNENAMSVMIFADGLKRAGASEIILITPYLGYSRQDRVTEQNEPITLKLITNLYKTSGIDKIINVDPHGTYDDDYFSLPVIGVSTDQLFGDFFIDLFEHMQITTNDVVILSPDHGGTTRSRHLQKLLPNACFASIEKKRVGPNQIKTISFKGDVKDKIVVIYDDILDTGQTILEAIRLAKLQKPKEIYVAVTHSVYSSHSQDFFYKAKITGVIVTNSIETSSLKATSVLSLASVLFETLKELIN